MSLTSASEKAPPVYPVDSKEPEETTVSESEPNTQKPEVTTASEPKAQEVTREIFELAEAAVKKLVERVSFSLSLGVTLERHYDTAKWVAVEVNTLETKKDAALALIELYENNLKRLLEYDLAEYYSLQKQAYEKDQSLESTEFTKLGSDIISRQKSGRRTACR